VLCLGTPGDLVLAFPALQRIRAAWPASRIVCLGFQGQMTFVEDLFPGIELLPAETGLLSSRQPADSPRVSELLERVRSWDPDLIVSVAARPHWLAVHVLAHANQTRRLVLECFRTEYHHTADMLPSATHDGALAWETVPGDASRPQWERMHDIADLLLGDAGRRASPKIGVSAPARDAALAWLRDMGLAPGEYLVCAPNDSAGSPLKIWPQDRLVAVAEWLWREKRLSLVLIGQEAERMALESTSRLVADRHPVVWAGSDADTPQLTGVISHSKMFIGQECGWMHLAAALDKPILGLFGGGTWPSCRPAAQRSIDLHAPLPCYGCNWECAFVDAPCLRQLSVASVVSGISDLLSPSAQAGAQIRAQPWPPGFPLDLAAKTGEQHQRSRREIRRLTLGTERMNTTLARRESEMAQIKAELGELRRQLEGKDNEHSVLRASHQERAELISRLDAEKQGLAKEMVRLTAEVGTAKREAAAKLEEARQLETRYLRLSPEAGLWADQLEDLSSKTRQLEEQLEGMQAELRRTRSALQERERSLQNLAAGLGTLELHRHYQRVIRELKEELFLFRKAATRLALPKPGHSSRTRSVLLGAYAKLLHSLAPASIWLRRRLVDGHWMQLGRLRQYQPRRISWDSSVAARQGARIAPVRIGLVTPCLNQAANLGKTLESVLSQHYAELFYVVKDGASQDGSVDILRRNTPNLYHWESERDAGLSEAITKGFSKLAARLLPEDIMGWLSADDMLAPGSLAYVAQFFRNNPRVDAIYGNRIVIDSDDREVGRWILPKHKPDTLRAGNLIPQETVFWRKRAWEQVGGFDPELHPCLSWDLLLRMQGAGARIARLPAFLAAKRIHAASHSGIDPRRVLDEEAKILQRERGGEGLELEREEALRRLQNRAALSTRLLSVGIRW